MKTRVLNPPARIFLQIVGDDDSGESVPYESVGIDEITWHDERIFDADLEYRLVKRPAKNRETKHGS